MSLLDAYTISFAQNREDLIIEAFFPDIKNGFYVDVGSNHPIRHSVTKRLYDRGWHGINIEPNPALFDMYRTHRKDDNNQNIGISNKEGKLKFRIYNSRDGLAGLSTFSESMKDHYSHEDNLDTSNYKDIEVKVTTLKKLFDINKVGKINFIKIDVEGYEDEVIEGNDWNKYRPELICIEANHLMKDWKKKLKENGYLLVFNDGLNDYYLAKESMHRLDYFDYSKIMLLNKPVISSDVADNISNTHKDLNNLVIELKNQVYNLQNEKISLVDQRNDLFRSLQQYDSIRNIFKLLIVKIHRRNILKIEQLQKPKRVARAPQLRSIDFNNFSEEELLKIAQDYDKKYLKPSSRGILYRHFLYVFFSKIYKAVFIFTKIIIKTLKWIKRLVK